MVVLAYGMLLPLLVVPVSDQDSQSRKAETGCEELQRLVLTTSVNRAWKGIFFL